MLSVNAVGQIIFYLALFINIVIFVPQIIKLWRSKDAKSVSLMTFFGFLLLQLIIVFHGISIGDGVLTAAYLLSSLSCTILLGLILFYQFKQKHRHVSFSMTSQADAAAERAKTEFLYNMKHDLRTPFSGILGMAEYLQLQEDDPIKKSHLNDITQSARILLGHLNEIFEFIHADRGSLPILCKPFNLQTLVEEVYGMLIPAAKERQITFRLSIDNNVPCHLIGDRVRTQRVLINVISNAIKFTRDGFVDIFVESNKSEDNKVIVIFKIIDTGIGIPKDKQDFVFEKFSRLTSSYQGIYPGKGLGLMMTKRFIDEMDGEICLESEINKGSSFHILIPYRVALLNTKEREP